MLNEFRTFIDENPNEVITLILEDYSTVSSLSDALSSSGIIQDLLSTMKFMAGLLFKK